MKLKTIITTFILLISSVAFSQDLIVKKSGEVIQCMILNDGAFSVSYIMEGDKTQQKRKMKRSLIRISIYGYSEHQLDSVQHLPKTVPYINYARLKDTLEVREYLHYEYDRNYQVGNNLVGAGIWLFVNVVSNTLINYRIDDLNNELNEPDKAQTEVDHLNHQISQLNTAKISINLISLGMCAGNLTVAGVKMHRRNLVDFKKDVY